jgi:thiosulfate/3-mercaptopyruvate sulfurtransferase
LLPALPVTLQFLESIYDCTYSEIRFLSTEQQDMRVKRKLPNFIGLFIVLTFISGCSSLSQQANTKKPNVPKMEALVTTQWLSEHLNDPDLVVLDTTVLVNFDDKGNISSASGRAKYEAGHIPTAGFADLMGNLSATDSTLDFVMPTQEQFRNAMGALGVGDDTRVVLYSAENRPWPARLWWMLRWAGFDQVGILDGGLKAWKDEGREISTAAATHPKRELTLSIRQNIIADRDEVFAAINNKQVSIIDAMPEGHYQGKFKMYARPGHILSATNMSSSDLSDGLGFFKSYDELDFMHEGDRNKRSITYCGGGVAASAVAFTMYRLGYSDVAVYMGSLQEWAPNLENPMTVENPKEHNK